MSRLFTAILIDDDLDEQLFFKMAARRIDVAVTCEFANDGLDGIVKLRDTSFKPDIIFTKIIMPRMDGMK